MADARIAKVTMPKWGLSMTSGKITEWLVEEGTEVEAGAELAEIDTDKIVGTLEAPAAGVLRRIIAETDSSAPVGATIAVVAPAEVPDADIDQVVAEAEEQLASGEVEEPAGPVVATVEVDGRAIAHATLGEGDEVVLLVHGYGGDKNSWLFVQEPLSRTRTVHAIDLPGHGESAKDLGDGSLDTRAATGLGFMDAVGVGRAHLVGHSLGGAVVTAVAASAPDRVSALTLVSPAGFGEVDASYLRGFAEAGSRRELRPHLGKLFAGAPPYPFHGQVREAVAPFIYEAIVGNITPEDALDQVHLVTEVADAGDDVRKPFQHNACGLHLPVQERDVDRLGRVGQRQ